jgi:hypothetical protein
MGVAGKIEQAWMRGHVAQPVPIGRNCTAPRRSSDALG